MKKIPFKKIGYALLAVLIIIQFFRPEKNDGESYGINDVSHKVNVPDDVKKILETSCFDCHSNHTTYPWYFNIQPVAWWINDHVEEGKHELNFSEYNTFKLKRQYKKLKKIAKEVKEHGMPMWQYTLIHTNAKLNEEQIRLIVNWTDTAIVSLNVPDSIKIK